MLSLTFDREVEDTYEYNITSVRVDSKEVLKVVQLITDLLKMKVKILH